MKKILLGIISILCMQGALAQQTNTGENSANDNTPINIDLSYKVHIKKNILDKETNYQGHFVAGRVAYFNEMNIVSYVAQNKCKTNNDCEIVKGTENIGVGYIVDIVKPDLKKDDVVLFLQINEKSLVNLRQTCEKDNKNCIDIFDISVLNFKQTLKMKENQPKTIQYNNVTYTITLNKD